MASFRLRICLFKSGGRQNEYLGNGSLQNDNFKTNPHQSDHCLSTGDVNMTWSSHVTGILGLKDVKANISETVHRKTMISKLTPTKVTIAFDW